jgi:hypothetical protein
MLQQMQCTHTQLSSALSAHREGLLRSVEAVIARSRTETAAEWSTALTGLRDEVSDGLQRFQGHAEGLGQALEQAKGELVEVLNKKAYRVDVAKALQVRAIVLQCCANSVLVCTAS